MGYFLADTEAAMVQRRMEAMRLQAGIILAAS
jgi:hypothetical protein